MPIKKTYPKKERRAPKTYGKDRRTPVVCTHCGGQMVCMNRFESVSELSRGFYAWFICPRRDGEMGCGYTTLMQVFPDITQPDKPVFSMHIKEEPKKKKTKK